MVEELERRHFVVTEVPSSQPNANVDRPARPSVRQPNEAEDQVKSSVEFGSPDEDLDR